MLAQVAERLHARQPGALEPLVRLAADQLDRQLQTEAPADAGYPGERLADDQADSLGIASVRGPAECQAHVAAAAARQCLGLVAEIAQDRVVAAAAALGPADQLEEHAPLVLDH